MRRRLVLSAVLLALLLATAVSVGGCDVVTGQQTGATLDQADPDALEADAAISGVTRSGAIPIPATITAGVLRAATDAAFPPLAFRAVVEQAEGDKVNKVTIPVGFEVDLCTAVAKKLGLTLEPVLTNWDEVIPALEDGRVDMIMSGMTITPEFEQQVSFTEPHLSSTLAIVAPLNSPVADPTALAGKIVGVQVDTPSHAGVMAITGVAEVRTYSTVVKAFSELASGHIQALVEDEIVSTYILANDPDLKTKVAISGAIPSSGGYAFAVSKGNTALQTAIDAALIELRAEGIYEKICAKWDVTGN